MKTYVRNQNGSAIVCAMTTILIISIIGANVLMNCTTRYNVTSKQVSAWRDALAAAEAGADIAFAETRKTFTNPATQFTATGWSSPDTSVGPWTYTMPTPIGPSGNLSATATVDNFRLWMVTAAIAFVLWVRPGYLGCVAREWMTRRRVWARASEPQARGALVIVWCARSTSTSITSSLPTVTVMEITSASLLFRPMPMGNRSPRFPGGWN